MPKGPYTEAVERERKRLERMNNPPVLSYTKPSNPFRLLRGDTGLALNPNVHPYESKRSGFNEEKSSAQYYRTGAFGDVIPSLNLKEVSADMPRSQKSDKNRRLTRAMDAFFRELKRRKARFTRTGKDFNLP